MTRETIGLRLAEQLYAAERAIDIALSEAATLTAMLPEARREAYLSVTVAQPAFSATAASVAALATARGELASAHRVLGALAKSLGLETLASGPVDKPDEERPGPGYCRPVEVNEK